MAVPAMTNLHPSKQFAEGIQPAARGGGAEDDDNRRFSPDATGGTTRSEGRSDRKEPEKDNTVSLPERYLLSQGPPLLPLLPRLPIHEPMSAARRLASREFHWGWGGARTHL